MQFSGFNATPDGWAIMAVVALCPGESGGWEQEKTRRASVLVLCSNII